MKSTPGLEVLFTPAEFNALDRRDLSETTCVVFDILRATSSMITALANGAEAIFPCREIAEAIAARKNNPQILLAGERNGVRITSQLTGSIDFDLGNSPREFTRDKVGGRTIAMTTTNGTRALRACASAKCIFIGSFLNLGATSAALKVKKPERILLVCSGTGDKPAYEDTLAAGALCELISILFAPRDIADSSLIALDVYSAARHDLLSRLENSQNGRRLMSLSGLRADVRFCAERDILTIVGRQDEHGYLRVEKPNQGAKTVR